MNFHRELLTLSCFVLVFTGINALDINLIACWRYNNLEDCYATWFYSSAYICRKYLSQVTTQTGQELETEIRCYKLLLQFIVPQILVNILWFSSVHGFEQGIQISNRDSWINYCSIFSRAHCNVRVDYVVTTKDEYTAVSRKFVGDKT